MGAVVSVRLRYQESQLYSHPLYGKPLPVPSLPRARGEAAPTNLHRAAGRQPSHYPAPAVWTACCFISTPGTFLILGKLELQRHVTVLFRSTVILRRLSKPPSDTGRGLPTRVASLHWAEPAAGYPWGTLLHLVTSPQDSGAAVAWLALLASRIYSAVRCTCVLM